MSNTGVWSRIVRPSPAVTDPVARRSARLVSSLLVVVTPLALLTGIGTQLSGDPRFTSESATWAAIACGVLGGAYVLSRTRHYPVARWVLVWIATVIASAVGITNPLDPAWYPFTIVSPIFAGMLLSFRRAAIAIGVHALVTSAVAWLVPGMPPGVPVMTTMLNVMGGGLLLVAANYRNEIEAVRRRQIADEEHKHRQVLDVAFDGLAVLDDGKIVQANRGFAAIFDCEESELLGNPLVDSFEADERARVRAALAGKIPGVAELRAVSREGRPRILELVTNARSEAVPRVDVVAIRDITQRRAAEIELQHSQRMDAVGRLAGGVAHDFNNLLTVLLGETDLLRLQLGETHKDAIESLKSATFKAADLTRQLLAFSRRQVLEPRTVDLHQVVTDMERMLGRLLREDITVRTTSAPGLYVRVDPTQLEQVIVNLAVNAGHAMPDGGMLSLVAKLDADEDSVVLVVRDTGIGIPRDRLAHIFEPFFTTRGRGEGTGLGLAVVHGIVRQSGGAISVDSEPGGGTTFTIRLPLVEASGNGVDASMSGPLPLDRGPRSTILLVEDEPGVAAVIERMLRDDHRVIVANSGLEAAAQLEGHDGTIEVAIIDVVLQDQNGAEVARAVRQRHPEAAILHISGYPEGQMSADGELLDDVMLLPKPFTTAQLHEAIDDAVRRRGKQLRAAANDG